MFRPGWVLILLVIMACGSPTRVQPTPTVTDIKIQIKPGVSDPFINGKEIQIFPGETTTVQFMCEGKSIDVPINIKSIDPKTITVNVRLGSSERSTNINVPIVIVFESCVIYLFKIIGIRQDIRGTWYAVILIPSNFQVRP